MTNREFYTTIANSDLAPELVEYATAAIAKLDAANEKRKNAVNKKALENAPIKESILAVLGTEAMTAPDVAAAVGTISTQKASALLRQLVADGLVSVTDVKVPKHGTLKAYMLVG